MKKICGLSIVVTVTRTLLASSYDGTLNDCVVEFSIFIP